MYDTQSATHFLVFTAIQQFFFRTTSKYSCLISNVSFNALKTIFLNLLQLWEQHYYGPRKIKEKTSLLLPCLFKHKLRDKKGNRHAFALLRTKNLNKYLYVGYSKVNTMHILRIVRHQVFPSFQFQKVSVLVLTINWLW